MPYKTLCYFVVPFWQSCNLQLKNLMPDPPCCCYSSIQHGGAFKDFCSILYKIPIVSLEKLTIDFNLVFQQVSWSWFWLLGALIKPLWKFSGGPLFALLHSFPLLVLHFLFSVAKLHKVSLWGVSSSISNRCWPFYTRTKIGESSLRNSYLVALTYHITWVIGTACADLKLVSALKKLSEQTSCSSSSFLSYQLLQSILLNWSLLICPGIPWIYQSNHDKVWKT